jgi:hypothetical protein
MVTPFCSFFVLIVVSVFLNFASSGLPKDVALRQP